MLNGRPWRLAPAPAWIAASVVFALAAWALPASARPAPAEATAEEERQAGAESGSPEGGRGESDEGDASESAASEGAEGGDGQDGGEPPDEQEAAAKRPAGKPKAAAGAGANGADSASRAAEGESQVADEETSRLSLQDHLLIHLGPVTIAPVVLVAMQVVPYAGEDAYVQAGDVAEQAGFRLRRARFGMRGRYEDQAEFGISAEIAADGEGAGIRLHDGWAGYTPWPFLRAYVGARTMPFSRSALVDSGNGALAERPLAVRAMAPFEQVGAQLDGDFADGAFGYTLALANGLQRGDMFYDGFVQNYSPFGNRFDGLAYAARLRSDPLGRLGPTMADEDHGPFRFGVGASYFFSDGGARDLHSAAGDALMHVEGFHLLLEALWNLSIPEEEPTRPTVTIEQVSAFALVAEAGYMILKEALGITGRFEWIDPDTNTENEGDNWLVTAGAGYQFLDRLLKVQAEYTHREEVAGLPLANETVLLQFQLQLSALQGTDDSPSTDDGPPPDERTDP